MAKQTKVTREPVEKVISVRRKEKFSHIPAEVLQDSVTKIGSIFDGRTPLRGLSGEEEKELLSIHLGIDPNHNEFGKLAMNFWAEMDLKVPSEGTELNISIDESGMPVVMSDYLKYRWLLRHKYVADSKEEMLNNPMKDFYLYDPNKEVKKTNLQIKKKKLAYAEFIKASEDEDRMDMLLRVLDNVNPSKMSAEQKENRLETLATTNPDKFIRFAQDKDLEIRSEIDLMVENGVLRKSGNTYFYIDEIIGDTIDESITFFKNKKNSSHVSDMRAKLKELR